ncbi:MAP7 domain-containing protein 2 isoform X3 [Cynoglossus semilaevis]|uniref:MAP7 domain-containing protein 2 isoform X3 n=1 Tax=Cynoglossus semilaevis TaxID=244447 RepID=UPI0007DCAA9C|nr:MAP7 domain-containing protein 2-like isoform X3 [Cynoglossus semilaevis]
MAETTGSSPSLRGLRAQIASAAQAQAQERRSLATNTSRQTSEAAAKPQGCQPVINGATLRTDDRLRVARERREEADRQQAVRGSQIMERDRKAKMQVERQLEERQKKVEEQRRKEELRRVAVEEKRRQKQEEEKEHYEAVMRRSMERSQRSEQRQKRWSWGGGSPHSNGSTEKRSSSSVSLKQLSDGTISKRLSSSSAALPKSPEQSRTMKTRSSSLTRVSVGRAQMSAHPDVEMPKDEEFHQCPRSALATPIHLPPRGPLRSRSSDRQKSGIICASADVALDQSLKEKPLVSLGQKRPVSPSTTSLGRNRSPSPTPKMAPKRTTSPAAVKQMSRSRPPSPAAVKQRPPSPHSTSTKTLPIQKLPLTPTGAMTLRKRDSKSRDTVPVQTESRTKEKEAGTNSAAEATKILAQNRRLMREQKEEQQRLQREEEEKQQQRLQKEEEEKQQRLQEEEEEKQQRLQKEEEEKQQSVQKEEEKQQSVQREEERLEEELLQQEGVERRLREQEEVGLAEEEAMRRAELQKERVEAETKAQEEAQRVREERNRIMEQNQQERLERRKRIEEIMRRTRKGESNDVKREEDEERSSEENREHSNLQLDQDKCDPSAVEHLEEPVNGTTEEGETEEKENHSTKSKQCHELSSPVPKDAFIHDSGLNGKSNQWSFGELIDVHTRTEDQNQVRINREGSGGGTKGTFGDPENLIKNMCSKQPSEAL